MCWCGYRRCSEHYIELFDGQGCHCCRGCNLAAALYDEGSRHHVGFEVQGAEAAGCKRHRARPWTYRAWGRRERDINGNGFALPAGLVIESLLVPGRQDFYDGSFATDLSTFINERFKFDLTWDDVAWLRCPSRQATGGSQGYQPPGRRSPCRRAGRRRSLRLQLMVDASF